MTLFITNRNQELLWKIINKNEYIYNLDENFKITSPNVSVELSQPIKGLIELSFVLNSKTHFFNLPLPDCIAVFVGI